MTDEDNFPRGFAFGLVFSAVLWGGLWALADLWWLP